MKNKTISAISVITLYVTQPTFLILKLTGYITWNWIWVFAPLWGFIVAVILLVFIGLDLIKLGKYLETRHLH